MLSVTFIDNGRSANANIPSAFGPALRSAITEIRNELGARSSGAHDYQKEDSLVRALNALGPLARALNHVVLTEDPDYDQR